MSHGTLHVFEGYLAGFRRNWRATLLTSFALPVLTLLGIGLGVGRQLTTRFDGVPYVQWIVPGLVAATAMNLAVSCATWPVLAKHSWTGTYRTQIAAPLRVADVLAGHLAFVLFRVLFSCLALLSVAAVSGAISSPSALLAVPVVLLLALAFAAPTFAFSATVRSEIYFSALTRFVIMPMSLFAGVFFPVALLPSVLRPLASLSPLTSGIDLIRAAMQHVATPWPVVVHLAYLAAWATIGGALAHHCFRRRLIT